MNIYVYHFEYCRGFFSWLNGILMTILICKDKGWKLYINSDFFWYKHTNGLEDYLNIFANDIIVNKIERDDIVLNPNPDDETHRNLRLGLFYHYDLNTIAIPEWNIKLEDSIFNKIRNIAQILWKPNEEAMQYVKNYFETSGLPESYSVLNCRRGDKITTGESQFIELERILQVIFQNKPDEKYIYLITDDYRSYLELQQLVSIKYTSITIGTNCLPNEYGFFINELRASSKEVLKEHTLRQIILSIEIAKKSNVYVGTYTSNYCRFIPLVHHNPTMCFSVDDAWYQNPNI